MGLGKLQSHLAEELQELIVLSLELDIFRKRRRPFSLLGDPAVYGILGHTVIFGGLGDRDAVILDAIN